MSKPYTDIFGKKLTKAELRLAVQLALRFERPYPAFLQRKLHIGYGKAISLLKVMVDAGVISRKDDGTFNILLPNEESAVNATLRQFKKGRI